MESPYHAFEKGKEQGGKTSILKKKKGDKEQRDASPLEDEKGHGRFYPETDPRRELNLTLNDGGRGGTNN